jgi:hypothetical protein
MNALVSLAAALASAVLVRIGKAGRYLFIKDKICAGAESTPLNLFIKRERERLID